MNMKLIPAVFSQSATILIDDDGIYIENVAKILPSSFRPVICKAEQSEILSDKPIIGVKFPFTNPKTDLVEANKNDILSKIDSGFLPVSVVVVDHCMEPKNGLEICKNIKSPFIQKILISNFVKNEQAIDALNSELIDFYICKMDNQFISKLTSAIKECRKRFFLKLSTTKFNLLNENSLFSEPSIQSLISKISKDFKAPYYYSSKDLKQIVFSTGNKIDKVTLSIFDENEINEISESFHAETATPQMLSLLKSRTVIPLREDCSIPDGEHWANNLKPLNIIPGMKEYYYAITNI